MTLLEPLKITSLLSTYEHCFIQSLHKAGRLISEQDPGTADSLLQLAFNPQILQPLPPSLLTMPIEYLYSHSALSLCHDSTHPQPAHPGMYYSVLNPSHNLHYLFLTYPTHAPFRVTHLSTPNHTGSRTTLPHIPSNPPYSRLHSDSQ